MQNNQRLFFWVNERVTIYPLGYLHRVQLALVSQSEDWGLRLYKAGNRRKLRNREDTVQCTPPSPYIYVCSQL